MAKLADLLAQKAALDQKIAAARRAERSAAIEEVRSLMARYGLTLADVAAGRRAAKPASTSTADAASGKPAKDPKPAGRKGRPLGKVAPKYRDPQTGSTWSGRGLKPRWLSAALAAGRSLDEFRLAAAVDDTAAAGPASATPGADQPSTR